jgi:hypothetical protein
MFLVLKSIDWFGRFASLSRVRAKPLSNHSISTAQGANSAALGISNKGEVVGYSFQRQDYQAFPLFVFGSIVYPTRARTCFLSLFGDRGRIP